jgi:hypothetical protein
VGSKPPFRFHAESTMAIAAPPDVVFKLLDDHKRLSSHMTKSSWMMAGSSMTIVTDEAHGQGIGSKMCLSGKVLGIELKVEEVVTQRQPPWKKTWATVGTPRLLVIGAYEMGFELSAQAPGSLLRVFIDYDLPSPGGSRWLGSLFGSTYAKWCTTRMATDAVAHFRLSNRPRYETN